MQIGDWLSLAIAIPVVWLILAYFDDLEAALASSGRDMDDTMAPCQGNLSHDEGKGIVESTLFSWIITSLEGEQDHIRQTFERQMVLDEDLVLRLLYGNHALWYQITNVLKCTCYESSS